MSFETNNVYKFFGIRKKFLKSEVDKAKKELMRKYHPDKNDTDDFYIKTQEIYEILTDPKEISLLKSYNDFGIDV